MVQEKKSATKKNKRARDAFLLGILIIVLLFVAMAKDGKILNGVMTGKFFYGNNDFCEGEFSS